jgi:hypothetical protein
VQESSDRNAGINQPLQLRNARDCSTDHSIRIRFITRKAIGPLDL